jgi:hypothetical protein
MKWFWVLFNQSTRAKPLVADQVDFIGVDPDKLCIGKSVDAWDERSFLAVTEVGQDGAPDDILQSAAGVPVFSQPLRSDLTKATIKGIQYLPISVRRVDGSAIIGFTIANILNRCEALDMRRSEYDLFPNDYFVRERRGKISGIRAPVLRRAALATDVHILRLKEYWAPVFVSELFVNIFRFGRYTGVMFRDVELS